MTLRRRTIAVVTLIVICVGFLCAQAWHEFVWFGARSRAAEARRTLNRLCSAQLRLLTDTGSPGLRYRDLGQEVERGNRYAYFVNAGPNLEERITNSGPSTPDPAAIGVQVDVHHFGAKSIEYRVGAADVPTQLAGELTLGANGECPKCAWALVALGNIDLDRELDVWSAATIERQSEKGAEIPLCEPFHEHEDLPAGPLDFLFH